MLLNFVCTVSLLVEVLECCESIITYSHFLDHHEDISFAFYIGYSQTAGVYLSVCVSCPLEGLHLACNMWLISSWRYRKWYLETEVERNYLSVEISCCCVEEFVFCRNAYGQQVFIWNLFIWVSLLEIFFQTRSWSILRWIQLQWTRPGCLGRIPFILWQRVVLVFRLDLLKWFKLDFS